jgi:hypothetical protein
VVNNFTQSAKTVVEAKKPLGIGKYFSVIEFWEVVQTKKLTVKVALEFVNGLHIVWIMEDL